MNRGDFGRDFIVLFLVIGDGQGRIFSAGVDLVRLTAEGPDYVRKFLPALHKLYDVIFFFPKPVVAAVNGFMSGSSQPAPFSGRS